MSLDSSTGVRARDLVAGYDNNPVVSANLDLRSGLICFIGPNASGKTTLARALAGVLKPLGGVVIVDGRDLYSLSNVDRSRVVGFLPTGSPRAPLMKVFDVVSMGRTPWRGLSLSSRDLKAILRSMDLAGVSELSDRYFNDLSDGQRQRVLIAMALAREPRVLILDEPTSFLDPINRIRIFDLLKEISKEILVIVTTHDIELASRYCDQVYSVKDGSVSKLVSWEGVGDLYGSGDLVYIPIVNSFEYRLPEGSPEIHLFGGCGSAFSYVRRNRLDMPVSVGPVFYSDLDNLALSRLGAKVYVYDGSLDLDAVSKQIFSASEAIAFKVPDECLPDAVLDLIYRNRDKVRFVDVESFG